MRGESQEKLFSKLCVFILFVPSIYKHIEA